jgi:pyruvate kinase
MRRTKIVATIGPASSSETTLRALLEAGVDVVRLNFSHGTHEEHAEVIETVRKLMSAGERPVAIMQDLQGPRIRTGELVDGASIELLEGNDLRITNEPVDGTIDLISIPDVPLTDGVSPGDLILIDEGKIRLRVQGTASSQVIAEVMQGGLLGERKAVNFSSAKISLPVLTQKDRADLEFGLAHQVDFVALSFIRQSRDLLQIRDYISAQGKRVPLVAKLERREAINDLRAVLAASDACMVARGDLGVEMSTEEVPVLQKRIIREANAAGKPVITATQMLESMITQPFPTRAEASDVANAVWDGTDAVMLSGETAVGSYPVAAVQTMARIIDQAEEELLRLERRQPPASFSHPQAVTQAARDLAERTQAKAIVALTRTGRTAALLSQTRPKAPIFAFSPDEQVCRQLAMIWGVTATLHPIARSTEMLMADVELNLLRRGLVSPRDRVVVVGALPLEAQTNFVTVHVVASPP